MSLERAVPVLQVANVATSIEWYGRVLGFKAFPFPEKPPYSFAILDRDGVELMLQCGEGGATRGGGNSGGWAAYLRFQGGRLLELVEAVKRQTQVSRGPQRMFYGMVEVDIADPDGHCLCLSEELSRDIAIPSATE
jgi:catechol 2,3-dioxygenase-like lactoylglutathione lyase family enzyme